MQKLFHSQDVATMLLRYQRSGSTSIRIVHGLLQDQRQYGRWRAPSWRVPQGSTARHSGRDHARADGMDGKRVEQFTFEKV